MKPFFLASAPQFFFRCYTAQMRFKIKVFLGAIIGFAGVGVLFSFH